MKSRVIILLMFSLGVLLFSAGSYGFYTLYDHSLKTEKTVGVVERIDVRKEYNHHRVRHRLTNSINYKRTAIINYETKEYGNMKTSVELSNPFIFQDTELSVWYYPNHAKSIIIPFDYVVIWGFIFLIGVSLVGFGVVIIRKDNT